MKFAELWTDTICKISNAADYVFERPICGKLNLTSSSNSETFSKMQAFLPVLTYALEMFSRQKYLR